jgi:hypothetical protein
LFVRHVPIHPKHSPASAVNRTCDTFLVSERHERNAKRHAEVVVREVVGAFAVLGQAVPNLGEDRCVVVVHRPTITPGRSRPLDLDVPVPVAALVGYEWRVTSRMKLTIRQRTRSGIVVIDGDGPTTQAWPAWTDTPLAGQTGPTVIAVSTTTQRLTEPARVYAGRVDATRTLEPRAPGELDAAGIRGLARCVAAALRDGNTGGNEKHLLLAGPCALGALIGAGANAAGAITAPLWNGSGYAAAVVFGD